MQVVNIILLDEHMKWRGHLGGHHGLLSLQNNINVPRRATQSRCHRLQVHGRDAPFA
jgi:hypothetical protein